MPKHINLRRRRSKQTLLQSGHDSEEDELEEDVKKKKEWIKLGKNFFRVTRPQQDSWMCTMIEVLAITISFLLLYGIIYHYEMMHYHVSKGYAHMGYPTAQHVVGQRLLSGRGVDQNDSAAMEWFKHAADQGHPEASYHLAMGQMQGIHSKLKKGESEKLLRHAANNGVKAAQHALDLCGKRGCD